MFGGIERQGYMVFQAKYRSHPGSSPENASWLIAQIDAELAKFADAKLAFERPDVYFMASNVRLSAAAANADGKGEGGIDKISRYLEDAAAKLGIREAVLWHADTLSTMLDIIHLTYHALDMGWPAPARPDSTPKNKMIPFPLFFEGGICGARPSKGTRGKNTCVAYSRRPTKPRSEHYLY